MRSLQKKNPIGRRTCVLVFISQRLTINNNRQQILDWNVRRRNTDTLMIIDYYKKYYFPCPSDSDFFFPIKLSWDFFYVALQGYRAELVSI